MLTDIAKCALGDNVNEVQGSFWWLHNVTDNQFPFIYLFIFTVPSLMWYSHPQGYLIVGRWLLQLQPYVPGEKKEELSQAPVKTFPNSPAERLVSTSHCPLLSAVEAWIHILLLGLCPHPTK